MEGDGGNESSPAQLMGTAESLRILVRRDLTEEMDSQHVILGCQDGAQSHLAYHTPPQPLS